MLSVDHYEVIRRKVRDGFSQREAAEQLGHGRNTVAKALKYPTPPGYRLSQPRAKPVIEPFTALLDQWIEDNKKFRPKQRQMAKKMYQRLCDEYGFTGHYTTVQRYVKQAQNRRWDSQGTSYPPEKDTVYDRQTIPGDPEDLGRGDPLPET